MFYIQQRTCSYDDYDANGYEDDNDDHDFVMTQDGNGYIDRRELALMMRFIGEPVTQEEIDVSHQNNHLRRRQI